MHEGRTVYQHLKDYNALDGHYKNMLCYGSIPSIVNMQLLCIESLSLSDIIKYIIAV